MQKGKAFVRMDVTHIPVSVLTNFDSFWLSLLADPAWRSAEPWRSQISLFIILLCYTKTPTGLSEYGNTEQRFCLGSNASCLQHTHVIWMTVLLLCHTLDLCYLVPLLQGTEVLFTFCLLSCVSSQVRAWFCRWPVKLYELQSAAGFSRSTGYCWHVLFCWSVLV